MMHRWIGLVVLASVVGCGKGEPSANGKTCSHWLTVMKEGKPKDKQEAIKGLAAIGIQDQRAIPALTDALKDEDSEVRADAARGLGRLGSKASGSVPNLVATLKDQSKEVRNEAAVALGEMDTRDPDAIKGLADLLKDLEVRRSAVNSLRRIGPPARDAIPAIKEAAMTDDADFRADAMDAVRSIELKLK